MNLERIGPYQFLDKLGSGGMGTVYLGKHVETGQLAAVKVLTASLAREPGFVERFNREIDAMRKLKNPHIVELFESGVDGENYYYAMEYVAGETLMSVMRREKRLPWERAVDFAAQICQALKAAHDAGIIHRDLKPSNLMVTSQGTVKLTDFGVAQVFASSRLTATGGIIGTAEYMSPEQAQGKRAGKQSDLYSLGAVMYAMVTGRTPFSGKTAVEVIQKHKFGLFDRPRMYVPDLPTRVDDTICRLLEKEPEKRFPDAFVLLRHLDQVVRLEELAEAGETVAGDVDERSTSDTTIAVTDRVHGTPPQHPGPATLMQALVRAELSKNEGGLLAAFFNNTYVLVALLALVIAGGIWWFRPRQSSPEELFERGRALLAHEPGNDWLRAKNEYLLPLLELDSETWGDRVKPLIQQVELYELTRPVRGGRLTKTDVAKSEGERLLQLAAHYRQIGDLPRAERTLAALKAILAGDDNQTDVYDMTGRLLDEVRGQIRQTDDRDGLMSAALERATERAQNGATAEAREIWSGLVELYGDDPSAVSLVQQAREGLEKTRPVD
jgi:serine/threonine-protein kinase